MKKNHIIFVLLVFVSLSIFARGTGDQNPEILKVYCYDSFSSEWGPGPIIAERFTESTGIQVEFHAPGDAVSVLNQLILEKNHPVADVVVGIDDSLVSRALEEGVLQPYRSAKIDNIPSELIFDETYQLLPYDYGHFSINYDSLKITNPPTSLEELAEKRFENQLILMDPRTSTPGLGFLLWTISVYGDTWQDYWTRLQPSILTITDGWSEAYALYTAGEAALVLSYGSSPFYHKEYEDTDQYRSAEFSEGHVRQIEGMGIVAGSGNVGAAQQFIDFMLENESQETLLMSNIMIPVIEGIELPESFDIAMIPESTVDVSRYRQRDNLDEIVNQWVEIFSR